MRSNSRRSRAARPVLVGALLCLIGSATVEGQSAQMYATRCATCHLPTGSGSPSLAPPLTGTVGRYAHTDEGRAYLAHAVIYGLSGAIDTDGGRFVGLMPAVPMIEDGEVAEVLNYVLTEFNAESLPDGFELLTGAEVASYRDPKLSSGEVASERRDLRETSDIGAEREAGGASTASLEGVDAAAATGARGSGRMASLRSRDARLTGPELHYISHCRGCHSANAMGVENVPTLADSVGYFTHTPEGREFLIRVPGVSRAPLNDREIADLLNWVLQRFSSDQLPADFAPYTEEEVARHRSDPLTVVSEARARILGDLRRRGVLPTGPGR